MSSYGQGFSPGGFASGVGQTFGNAASTVGRAPAAVGRAVGRAARGNIMRTVLYALMGIIAFILALVFFWLLYRAATKKMTCPSCPNCTCGTPTSTTTATVPPGGSKGGTMYGTGLPKGNDACEDNNANCPGWAANDECWINPGYMLNHCRKSCKTCGLTSDQINQIRDSNLAQCQDWRNCQDVDCRHWYQKLRCRKTCNTHGCGNQPSSSSSSSSGTNTTPTTNTSTGSAY